MNLEHFDFNYYAIIQIILFLKDLDRIVILPMTGGSSANIINSQVTKLLL